MARDVRAVEVELFQRRHDDPHVPEALELRGVVADDEGLERVAVLEVEVEHERVHALVQDEVGVVLREHVDEPRLQVPHLDDRRASVVQDLVVGAEALDVGVGHAGADGAVALELVELPGPLGLAVAVEHELAPLGVEADLAGRHLRVLRNPADVLDLLRRDVVPDVAVGHVVDAHAVSEDDGDLFGHRHHLRERRLIEVGVLAEQLGHLGLNRERGAVLELDVLHVVVVHLHPAGVHQERVLDGLLGPALHLGVVHGLIEALLGGHDLFGGRLALPAKDELHVDGGEAREHRVDGPDALRHVHARSVVRDLLVGGAVLVALDESLVLGLPALESGVGHLEPALVDLQHRLFVLVHLEDAILRHEPLLRR